MLGIEWKEVAESSQDLMILQQPTEHMMNFITWKQWSEFLRELVWDKKTLTLEDKGQDWLIRQQKITRLCVCVLHTVLAFQDRSSVCFFSGFISAYPCTQDTHR